MKLERLLQLAGLEDDQLEEAMAKYNEPKANHAHKTGAKDSAGYKKPVGDGHGGDGGEGHGGGDTGDDNVKPKEGHGNKPPAGKYNEPHAAKGPKKGKEEKAPEGKLKVASKSKYTDHNSTQ